MKNHLMPKDNLVLRSTRDEMLDDILSRLRISRYDLKFLRHIRDRYVKVGKPLTHSQNESFERIIRKYRKQISKLNCNIHLILNLKWKHGLIEKSEIVKKSFLTIKENDDGNSEIQLFYPFNLKMNNELRSIMFDDHGRYYKKFNFTQSMTDLRHKLDWDKNRKIYYGPFNIYLYKELYAFYMKHKLPVDKNIIEKVKKFDRKINWTPSVFIKNDRLYISMVTESMIRYIDENNIDLEDISFSNIAKICDNLHLSLPDEYYTYEKFLGENPIISISCKDDLNELSDYLKITNRGAFTIGFAVPDVQINNEIKVKYADIKDNDYVKKTLSMYNTIITTMEYENVYSFARTVGRFNLKDFFRNEDKKVITIKYEKNNNKNKRRGQL